MENKDLKTGMILVTIDNEYVMVLKGTALGDIVSGDAWASIKKDVKIVDELKVKKIYQPENNMSFLSPNCDFHKRGITKGGNTDDPMWWRIPPIFNGSYKLIWERKDQKEMTIAEIEKELGYSIKIIKEDK